MIKKLSRLFVTRLVWGALALSQIGLGEANFVQANTVLDMQNLKKTSHKKVAKLGFQVTLINLNPEVNRWYLVQYKSLVGGRYYAFHLENAKPASQWFELADSFDEGIMIVTADLGAERKCRLFPAGKPTTLVAKTQKAAPFVGVCGNALYLRNNIEGYQSTKEWAAQFLRDNVWAGDTITALVKNTVYKDKYLIEAAMSPFSGDGGDLAKRHQPTLAPPAALTQDPTRPPLVIPEELGLTPKNPEKDGMLFVGQWYEVAQQPGMLVSVMRPQDVNQKYLASFPEWVNPLDSVESEALVYLVAMDTSQFDFEYALGTEHPRLEWSTRPPYSVRNHPIGPDGIGDTKPLVRTGAVSPVDRDRVVATFTAGFKRLHGAFRFGALSLVNAGSHYGFLENGVMFSRLHENLATIMIDYRGRLAVRTWQKGDDRYQLGLKHARQNGVPLIEWDATTKTGVPGALVGNWKLGNWSGNEHAEQRSLRAGLCRKRAGNKDWWIYGYFSSVNPSAMARVFQAYQCDYAIHMDMNALEHTYFAHYISKDGQKGRYPEHLVTGMAILDKRYKGNVPRFIGYPDNRDFFYVMRK